MARPTISKVNSVNHALESAYCLLYACKLSDEPGWELLTLAVGDLLVNLGMNDLTITNFRTLFQVQYHQKTKFIELT